MQALKTHFERSGWEVFLDLSEPDLDLILLTDPRKSLRSCAFTHLDIRNYLREVNPRALVVHRVNECDERKETSDINPLLAEANEIADHTIFVSAWLRDLHAAHFPKNGSSTVILNGSDLGLFHDQGQVPWDGQEPLRLVTHHFSNQWNKGFDVYQWLDEKLAEPEFAARFSFSYLGKVPEGFTFKRAHWLEPLSGEALREELVSHHVYVTASRFEPGANHQNEGALCGLPLLYLRHASMPEYADGYGVSFDRIEDFGRALEEMRRRYPEARTAVQRYRFTATRAAREYLAVFDQLLSNREALLEQRQERQRRRYQNAIPNWVQRLDDSVPKFLESLRRSDQSGAYYLSLKGGLTESINLSLGYTCFALKAYYTLNRWKTLPEEYRRDITRHIQSYQQSQVWPAGWIGCGAFVDSEAMRLGARQIRALRPRTWRPWWPWASPNDYQKLVVGETKQALASLYQVGAEPRRAYEGFPASGAGILRWLESYDWSKPWAAGGQAACLALFVSTQLTGGERVKAQETMRKFYRRLAQPATGLYHRGDRPEYGESVNGTMKVLTALDWLEEEIHFPQQLIDSVLAGKPPSTGCHLVDAIYVLYRCARECSHRRTEVQAYAQEMLSWIQPHVQSDGGLSYHAGQSQVHYYQLLVAKSWPVSDLHGTSLLIWAIAMCLELLEANALGWKVMRP
jgi:hypothetical protein